jgi:hypothetical protein
MRKSLKNYIENAQLSIAETTFKHGMYSKHVNYLTEGYLHTLLFQVYAIEMLNKNQDPSALSPSDNLVLTRKIFLLDKLKKFYITTQKRVDKIPSTRTYIPKHNSNELRHLTIHSIIDRAIQQLFLLVLDPIIECNSDKYSFGFRKAHSHIMAIGTIQKKLQIKPSRGKITSINYPYI